MTSTVNNTETLVVCDECWLSFEPINGRKSKLCTSCAPSDNALSCNDNIDTKSINAEDDNTITKDVDKLIICSECDTTEEKVVLSNKIMRTSYEQKILDNNANANSVVDIDVPEVCAHCGTEGSNLNTCNRCNLVKYCNAACKKKHRSKHKKKCDRRVAELRDEELFKEHPPNEECPICIVPMPNDDSHKTFRACCGKTICNGCVHGLVKMDMLNIGIDELMQNYKQNKEKIQSLCPFCRMPLPESHEEYNTLLEKLVENGNAMACYNLGSAYAKGGKGITQDMTKANELYLKGGELECATAYNNLAASYHQGLGVEKDEKKAQYYFELGALGGCLLARKNLASMELRKKNYHRAFKHFIIAAKAGDKQSLDAVKKGYVYPLDERKKGRSKLVTKDEYANTLRAYQNRQDQMKSTDRQDAVDFAEILEMCKDDPRFKLLLQDDDAISRFLSLPEG